MDLQVDDELEMVEIGMMILTYLSSCRWRG